MIADWLQMLEARLADGGEEELAIALVSIAYVASAAVELPDEDRRAAGRRGLLLLTTGGDPLRGLDLDGRAVTGLAAEIETPERMAALARGLDELAESAAHLPHVIEVTRALRADMSLAWRAFAASVLADELDD